MDQRLIIIKNKKNKGPFISRNLGVLPQSSLSYLEVKFNQFMKNLIGPSNA